MREINFAAKGQDMSDEEFAFRRQLESEPENKQLRAVFADWLEERGDCRADLHRKFATREIWPCKSHRSAPNKRGHTTRREGDWWEWWADDNENEYLTVPSWHIPKKVFEWMGASWRGGNFQIRRFRVLLVALETLEEAWVKEYGR